MKKTVLQAFINECGFTQQQICDRLGWRKEKMSRLINDDKPLTMDEIGEIAMVLGKSVELVRSMAHWRPALPKTSRLCPWCDAMVSIIVGDTEVSTMENVPTACPSCFGLLDIMADEEEEYKGQLVWWLTRAEV
jgi:hypothetical protein